MFLKFVEINRGWVWIIGWVELVSAITQWIYHLGGVLDRAEALIRNRNCNQWAEREELFERERSTNPDYPGWGICTVETFAQLHALSRRKTVHGCGDAFTSSARARQCLACGVHLPD